MRLLYLTDRLSDRGGADHHLRQVLGSAVDAGYGVAVGYGRGDRGGVKARGLELHHVRSLASRVDSSAGMAALDRLLETADLVHMQNVMNPTAMRAAAAHDRLVVTVQDHRVFCPGPGKRLPEGTVCREAMADDLCRVCLPDAGYRRSTLRLTRHRLAAIESATLVVLSRYMADELARVGRPDAVVLPPWVDPGPPRGGAGAGFVLGGRLVAHKGSLDGWRAWCLAGRPQPLVVAGSGPLARDLDGADRRGWLEPAELHRVMAGARALLFPSRWQEPFGMLGVEALARGTPVVVADSGGTADWSDEGCLRVPAGDVAAMADAIRRLAADPGLASRLGRRGQEVVVTAFSRRSIEPRLHRLYHSVLSA
ncbi:MAG: glycosyltransferase family 4 protein [Holophagae bacterium]